MDERTVARRVPYATMALLVALGAAAVPARAAPDVAHGSSRTSPVEGAVAELSRRTPGGVVLTRVVVLDGATTTASTTQPPTANPIAVAHLSVMACSIANGRPHGCRTVTNRAYDLDADSFTVDPLLRSALLDLGRGRRRVVVEWHGRGDLVLSTSRWARRVVGDPATGDAWWEVEVQAGAQSSRLATAAVTIGGRAYPAATKAWVFRGTATYGGTSGCALEALAPC